MNVLRAGIVLVALTTFAVTGASAALLTGSVSAIPAEVNLTDIGNTDWVHWGDTTANDITRKATGGSKISNLSIIGAGSLKVRLTDSASKYSWSDGTAPRSTMSKNPGGVYINNFDGPGRGFQFTVPADPLTHVLGIYVGEFNASGTLTAILSDASAPTYSQTLTGSDHTVQGFYKIDYASATPGQTLTVKWVESADLGQADNITIQAVAMCTPSLIPEPGMMGLMAAGGFLLAMRRKRA